MPRCKICRTKCERLGFIALCSTECANILAKQAWEKQRKAKERQAKAIIAGRKQKLAHYEKKRLNQKRKDRQRKKELRKRSEWYALIQKEVNWYAKHVLYRGHPCYTCGKPQRADDHGGAFHAGHYRTIGACPELRFDLRNIRAQCFRCNAMESGMRDTFRCNLLADIGEDQLAWLDGPHPSLTEQFPTWQDLEAELKRWRKINREHKRG